MHLATLIIIPIVIIALFTLWGAHKGFLRMLIPFFSLFLALTITKALVNPATDLLIKNSNVMTKISSMYEDNIPSFEGIKTSAGEISAIKNSTLPEFLKEPIIDNNNTVVYEELGVDNFKDYVDAYVSKFIVKIIVFVGMILVFFVILRLICTALKLVSKLPILHGISGFLGGLVGFFIGIIIALIAVIVICMFFAKTSDMSVISKLTTNEFVETIMNNNIFLNWIK